MSDINSQNNQEILFQKDKLKKNPSLSLSFSENRFKKKIDFFLTFENVKKNKNTIKIHFKNNDDIFERIRLIDEIISESNQHVNKINFRLDEISKIEKSIKTPLKNLKKLEILQDNKIKKKLNLKNLSLTKKLKKISEMEKKIEAEIIFDNAASIPNKELLKELKKDKEFILLKMNENDNEINKLNDKDKKYLYKENQKDFIENIEKIKERNNRKKYLIKKNILLIADNYSNTNEVFNKCNQEVELQKRLKEEQIKEQKYKELREKELEKIKERKKI